METMKAVVFKGKDHLALEEVPKPVARAGQAIIRITTTTICGTDVRSAVAAIAESAPFEIVLLDVRLPDSDDLALFDRVRSLAPEARIILMTAHGTRDLTERAMNRGAFTVVSKPFELTELGALVTRAHEARPS